MPTSPQQINPQNFLPSVGVGVNLPFNANAVFQMNFTTEKQIKANLINFMLTNPTDVYLNTTYGAGLRQFLFTQINNDNMDFIKEDISQKIKQFFPTVSIISLEILRNDDLNSYDINLDYSIAYTGIYSLFLSL